MLLIVLVVGVFFSLLLFLISLYLQTQWIAPNGYTGLLCVEASAA